MLGYISRVQFLEWMVGGRGFGGRSSYGRAGTMEGENRPKETVLTVRSWWT